MTPRCQVTSALCGRIAGLVGLVLSVGCSPLVATIGFEDEVDSSVVSLDAGELDAGAPQDASSARLDATLPSDATLAPAGNDAAVQTFRCWPLPDLVVAIEAGVGRLEDDDVFGATDPALGCDGGMISGILPVTYGRNDIHPLIPAGQSYALAWPSAILSGVGALNYYVTAERCEQTTSQLMIPLTVLPLVRGCLDLPRSTQDARALRMHMPVPTAFPGGLKLCDAPCSQVQPP